MKKFKTLLIKLFKIDIFINPEFKENQELLIINDPELNVKRLSNTFGISDERIDYIIAESNKIHKKMYDESVKNKTELPTSKVLFEISKLCKHKNELAIMMYYTGYSEAENYLKNKFPMLQFFK